MGDTLTELRRVKADIRKLFKKWRPRFGLHGWKIELNFILERDEGLQAQTIAQWEYKQAAMNFYMPALVSMSADDLEELMVHELIHIIVAPMQGDDDNTEYRRLVEFSVTQITETILRTQPRIT